MRCAFSGKYQSHITFFHHFVILEAGQCLLVLTVCGSLSVSILFDDIKINVSVD